MTAMRGIKSREAKLNPNRMVWDNRARLFGSRLQVTVRNTHKLSTVDISVIYHTFFALDGYTSIKSTSLTSPRK